MKNFEFYNPVRVVFGKETVSKLRELIPSTKRVMITYGGGSIKANGVYQAVYSALDGYALTEFGGIEPNPTYETLMKAVEKAKLFGADFLLAVGGGSVLDGTKFIAAAMQFDGDPWNILVKRAPVSSAIPLGTVLTLPATGSEMNSGGVISRKETQEKFPFSSPFTFPLFSILDPLYTYSLPTNQIANGTVDAYIHVMEQYLTYPNAAMVQDRWAEGLLQTLLEVGPKALDDPGDYDIRANLMWAATMALNGIIAVGVAQDWGTHMIGHELTALHGLAHGETLAIIYPSMMEVMFETKKEKMVQYAERVWGITEGTDEEKASLSIRKTESFFNRMGLKTKLGDYGIGEENFEKICTRFADRGWVKMGEKGGLTPELIMEVLKKSL